MSPARHSPSSPADPRARAIGRRQTVRWLLITATVATASGCQQLSNPAAQVELQESLFELQDLLVQMREETSMLQWQVDSLQGVVARQDTSMRRMANLLGMPIP